VCAPVTRRSCSCLSRPHPVSLHLSGICACEPGLLAASRCSSGASPSALRCCAYHCCCCVHTSKKTVRQQTARQTLLLICCLLRLLLGQTIVAEQWSAACFCSCGSRWGCAVSQQQQAHEAPSARPWMW
jgi:hypothetical protein